MNWEIAGVVAEIVGSITVIITLFYLAVQIRQNRIAVETESQASIAGGWNTVNAVILGSAEVGDIWAKGFDDPDSLNASEKVRFMALGQSYVNQFTLEKKLADRGALSPGQWNAHVAAMNHLMSSKGGQYLLETVAIDPEVLNIIRDYDGPPLNAHFLEINLDSGKTGSEQ